MDSKQASMAPATSVVSDACPPKPKPCCVCKEEKNVRDECMLFTNAKDPLKECATTIDKYKSCMAGFGFQLP